MARGVALVPDRPSSELGRTCWICRDRGRRAEPEAPAFRRHQHDRPARAGAGAARSASRRSGRACPTACRRWAGGSCLRCCGGPPRHGSASGTRVAISRWSAALVLNGCCAARCSWSSPRQRSADHQPFTKWLIRRMDAVIATSARSGAFLDVPHTVVMHGVDLDGFIRRADRRTSSRRPACPAIRRRLLRPRPPAEGHRSLRRRDDRAAAAISRLDGGDHRPRDGREQDFRTHASGPDRGGRPVGSHPCFSARCLTSRSGTAACRSMSRRRAMKVSG